MIVDCHTHISCTTGEFADAAERLAAQETVDKCIVLASTGAAGEQTNNETAEFAAKYPEKIVPFAVINPAQEDFNKKTLTKLNKQGFKGLVLYCCQSDFHPAHSRAMLLYEIAQELELPVFFHNGPDLAPNANMQYAQPVLLDEIARKFVNLKIIISSMGLPFIEQTAVMLAKHPNVYADLAIKTERPWQLYTTVNCCYEYGVLNKLLFGSGFPYGSADTAIEALLGFNKRMGDTNLPAVPRGELRDIIERDTLGLLGISCKQ